MQEGNVWCTQQNLFQSTMGLGDMILDIHAVLTEEDPDDLTYLHRGGRISGATKVVGGLLNIKPVLYFDNEGKIVSVAKARGFRNAISKLLGYVEEKGSELDKYKMFVLQADCEELANNFADTLRERFNADVVVQPVGPVIAAHCGPGTIGLIFHCSER